MGRVMTWFDSPLRSAALGMLIVSAAVLLRGLLQGRAYRRPVLVLTSLAIGMIVLSEGLQ